MNSGSVHRLSSTLHYLSKYDYSPYGQEITEDDLVIKENGSGSENVSNKIRIYQVTAINPSIRIHSADHLNLSPIECIRRREKCGDGNDSTLNISSKRVPSLLINCDCIDSQFVVPMYPIKLVSQAQKDTNLIKKCYSSLGIKMMHCSSRVLTSDDQGVTWFQPANLQLKMSSLSLPNISNWSDDIVRWNVSLQIETCKVRLSRPQSMVLYYIQSTWMQKDPSQIKLCPTIIQDAMTRKLPSLTIILSNWYGLLAMTKTSLTVQSHCNDFGILMSNASTTFPILSTISPTSSSLTVKTFSDNVSPGRVQNIKMGHWFKLDVQVPTSPEYSENFLSLLAMQIGEVDVNFDPKFFEWLTYSTSGSETTKKSFPSGTQKDHEKDSKTKLKVPSVTKSRPRSKSPRSEKMKNRKPMPKSVSALTEMKSSTVTQSGCQTSDDIFLKEIIDAHLNSWYPMMRALLVQVQIDRCCIFMLKKSLGMYV